MRKFAATILALALATTHGLLDEGGPNVHKKGAIKGGKIGSSRVREGRVGRKLDFGFITQTPTFDVGIPTPAPTGTPTLQPMPEPTPGPTPQPTPGPTPQPAPVWKSKFRGAFVPKRRVDLHAVDAASARWRGGAGSSPLDGVSTTALSPRNDIVELPVDSLV